MEKLSVVSTIQFILRTKYAIPEEETQSHLNTSLFLKPFNLDAVSMVYFFLLLNDVFHIEIRPEWLKTYKCITINNIAERIMDCDSVEMNTNGIAAADFTIIQPGKDLI